LLTDNLAVNNQVFEVEIVEYAVAVEIFSSIERAVSV
jgi:hypothetical protein